MALAINCLVGGHFDPPFADAVLLHVLAFVVVQADADFVLEHSGYVVAAARVRGQTVWQWRALEGVGHGVPWVPESCEQYHLPCRTLTAHRASVRTRVHCDFDGMAGYEHVQQGQRVDSGHQASKTVADSSSPNCDLSSWQKGGRPKSVGEPSNG